MGFESDEDYYRRIHRAIHPDKPLPNEYPKGEFLDILGGVLCMYRSGTTETQTKIFDEKGETTMTNNTMTTVTLRVWDEDESLGSPSNNNLVAVFKDVVVRQGEGADKILLKVAMDGSLKEAIDKHNKARVELPNKKTLERTGKKVMLEEVTIDDLRVTVE